MLKDIDINLPLCGKIERRFGIFYEDIFLYLSDIFTIADGWQSILFITAENIAYFADAIIIYNIEKAKFLFRDKYYTIKEFSKILNLLSFYEA